MKRTIFSVAAALAFVASASIAQAQMPISVGVAAGASLPTGTLGDATKTGWNALATVAMQAPIMPVGLRMDGMYNQLSGKTIESVAGPKVNVMGVNANVVYALPGVMVKPYLIGGAGWYNSKADVDGAESQNNLGFNAGVGTKFALSGMSAFAEARWHVVPKMIETGTDEYQSGQFVPISFGLMF